MWTKTLKCEEKDAFQRRKAVPQLTLRALCFLSKYTSQFVIQHLFFNLTFSSFGKTGTRSVFFSALRGDCIYKALHEYLSNGWMRKAYKVIPLGCCIGKGMPSVKPNVIFKTIQNRYLQFFTPRREYRITSLLQVPLLSFPSTYQLFSHTAALKKLQPWPLRSYIISLSSLSPTFLLILYHKRLL